MKRLILIVALFASILANAQVLGVYCDKNSIAPEEEEATLKFVVTGGTVQYFCYTDGTDYCMVEMDGNIYTKTVRPIVDTRYWITYLSSGSIDPYHSEVYLQVLGSPINVQTKFDLPESCFDTDAPISLKPLFWSNVPNYEELVQFDGPGVDGCFFYPNSSGGPGVKSIKAHFYYNGADHGIIRDIKVIRYGTGIDEDLQQDVSLYPNPTSGILNLPKPCTTEIYSTTGSLLKRFENVDVIDISDLSIGIYYVKMIDDSKQSTVQRIVKN